MKKDEQSVSLVIVGSIGIDTIETPFERREDLLGGSVSYACASASFFTEVGMVGITGDDFPESHVQLYDRFGIDRAGLVRAHGKTFRWSGVYEADMINRQTLSTELNVFAEFKPELPPAYRGAPFVLLGNISPELQLHVLGQTHGAGFVAADTMDLWIDTAREPLLEMIGKVDLLALNDEEARLLVDRHNIKECAFRIMDWGPRFVVVKKGEHGAILFSREGIFILPAYPVDAVKDPTGAGDCFAGAFMGALAHSGSTDDVDVRRSLLYGSVVASFGVESFSLDRLASLTPEEIERRLGDLRRMIAV